MTMPAALRPISATGIGNASRDTPGISDRVAWRDAAIAWLAQRAIFLALTVGGQALLLRSPLTRVSLYRPWVGWDAVWYARIAHSGYTLPEEAAFYPLYPLLEHLAAPLFAGHQTLAGLAISNAACLGTFALLRVLVEREFDLPTARRALLYLVCFPYAFYLAAAYTESTFLLLSLGAFLALRQHHWLAAGALAALATLTRPVGVILVVPLAAEALAYMRGMRAPSATDRQTWGLVARVAGSIALPLVALAGFWAYLATRYGTPFASARAQESHLWARQLSWPWEGLASVAAALLHPPAHMATANAVLDLGFTLAFIALALAVVGRLPAPYVFYTCSTLLLVLATPIHTVGWAALSSNPRFMLVVFPLFVLLARWSSRWAQRLVLVGSGSLLVVLGLVFANGAFLA